MGGAVIQELRQLFHGMCGAVGLLSCKFTDGGEQCGVDGTRVKRRVPNTSRMRSLSAALRTGVESGSAANCVLAPRCHGCGECSGLWGVLC